MPSIKQRAVSDSQKAQRRQDILDSARELFKQSNHYDSILMVHIAKNISLTKGTLYLYFKTKEEVFLALYQQEFDHLIDRLIKALDEIDVGSVDHFHSAIIDSMLGYDTFLRLNGMLHSVLEHNIEEGTALNFKTFLRDHLVVLSAKIEGKFPELKMGEGAQLMLLIHEVLIGTYHAASPSPCLESILERPDMSFMKLDFEQEFSKLLSLVLKGFFK